MITFVRILDYIRTFFPSPLLWSIQFLRKNRTKLILWIFLNLLNLKFYCTLFVISPDFGVSKVWTNPILSSIAIKENLTANCLLNLAWSPPPSPTSSPLHPAIFYSLAWNIIFFATGTWFATAPGGTHDFLVIYQQASFLLSCTLLCMFAY